MKFLGKNVTLKRKQPLPYQNQHMNNMRQFNISQPSTHVTVNLYRELCTFVQDMS